VTFEGDDGRRSAFRFAGLPLPGWHEPTATAFAARTGPGGGLRTLASARSVWDITARFLRFLASQQPQPAEPGSLRAAHLDLFRSARAAAAGPPAGLRELRQVLALLGQEPLRGLLCPEAADYLDRRWADPPPARAGGVFRRRAGPDPGRGSQRRGSDQRPDRGGRGAAAPPRA